MMLSVVNWWAVCRRMAFLIFEWFRGSVMPRGPLPVDPRPRSDPVPFSKVRIYTILRTFPYFRVFPFCHSKTFVHIADRSLKIRLDIPRKSSGGAVIGCDLLRCPVLLWISYQDRCGFNHAISSFCNEYFICISSPGILQ